MTDIEFQRHFTDLERYLRSDAATRVQAKAWLARLFRQLGDPLPEAAPVGDDDSIPDLADRIAEARARELGRAKERMENDGTEFCPVSRFRDLMNCEERRNYNEQRRKERQRAAREATR